MDYSCLPDVDCLYLRETRCCGIRIFWFLMLLIPIIFDCFFIWFFHTGVDGLIPLISMLFGICTAIIFMIIFAMYLNYREYTEMKSIDDIFNTPSDETQLIP